MLHHPEGRALPIKGVDLLLVKVEDGELALLVLFLLEPRDLDLHCIRVAHVHHAGRRRRRRRHRRHDEGEEGALVRGGGGAQTRMGAASRHGYNSLICYSSKLLVGKRCDLLRAACAAFTHTSHGKRCPER